METPKEFVEKTIDECYSSHMNANDLRSDEELRAAIMAEPPKVAL